MPLSDTDRKLVEGYEEANNNATTDADRAAANNSAWEIRLKYLEDVLPGAIDALTYDGIIKGQYGVYEYDVIECSIPVLDFIYMYATMTLGNNFVAFQAAFANGESAAGAVVFFYGLEAICFTGETLVLTSEGYKEIQDINIGDKVLSTDENTGNTEYKRVVNRFINETDTLVYVEANEEQIQTTPTHPFWVVGKGWVPAEELLVGDNLLSASGEEIEILAVTEIALDTTIYVYNLEVEDWHTYHVSESNILVHNLCYIIGNTHGLAEHRDATYQEMLQLNQVLGYTSFVMNLSLNTAGLYGSERPDIIAYGPGLQTVFVEVRGVTQGATTASGRELDAKLQRMIANNPGTTGYVLDVDYSGRKKN